MSKQAVLNPEAMLTPGGPWLPPRPVGLLPRTQPRRSQRKRNSADERLPSGEMGTNAVEPFMVPGIGHCGGGPGASKFDPLEQIDSWVTKNKAPQHIVAGHLDKLGQSIAPGPSAAIRSNRFREDPAVRTMAQTLFAGRLLRREQRESKP